MVSRQERAAVLREEIDRMEKELPYIGAFAGRAREGMVRKQSRKIDQLRKRLEKLEGKQ